MRNTLEIYTTATSPPARSRLRPTRELKCAVDRVARFKSQLTEQLDEARQTILASCIYQHIIA